MNDALTDECDDLTKRLDRATVQAAGEDLDAARAEIDRLRDECARLTVQAAGAYGPADIERARTNAIRDTGPPSPKMLREAANILETAPYERTNTAAWLRDVADEIEPEPDPAAVTALVGKLKQIVPDNGDWVACDEVARGLIRDGVHVEVPDG